MTPTAEKHAPRYRWIADHDSLLGGDAEGLTDSGFAPGHAHAAARGWAFYAVRLYDAATGRLLGEEGVHRDGEEFVRRMDARWTERGRSALDAEMRRWLRRFGWAHPPAPPHAQGGAHCITPVDLRMLLRFAARAVWLWHRDDPAARLDAVARVLDVSLQPGPWTRSQDEADALLVLWQGIGLGASGVDARWPPTDEHTRAVSDALAWLWEPLGARGGA